MKKTLLLFLLLPFLGFAQLSGDYVISNANTDANFKTLTAAVDRLYAVGVNGPVRFLLDENQTVTSQIVINSFNNPNSSTVTIKPNNGKDITVSGNVAGRGVIEFNNGDNIIIDGNNSVSNNKLKIYNTFNNSGNSYTNRAAIWLYNGSDNNIIQNLTLELNIVGADVGVVSAGIFAAGSPAGSPLALDPSSTANNLNNTIQNVVFTKVKQAIIVRGQSTSNSDWKILNNVISSTDNNTKAFIGIYILNASNYTVTGNTINGIRTPSGLGGSTNHSGIYLDNANTGVITQNTVSNIESNASLAGYGILVKGNNASISQNTVSAINSYSSSYGANGIRLEGNDGTIFRNKINSIISSQSKGTYGIYTAGNNQLVYNNFVLDVNSSGGGDPSSEDGFGIYINSGSNIKLYHNTVKLTTNQASGTSGALFVKDGSGFDIRNNIFINAQTSGSMRFAVYFATSDLSKFPTLDYNNYYSTQHIGTLGSHYTTSNIKSTIAQWRTATGKETNSKNENPTFSSSLYLEDNTLNRTLIGASTVISTVTTDIDGSARVKPFMGAHELYTCVVPGDQTSFGSETWIGYAYSFTGNTAPNPTYNTLPTGTTYLGTLTENTKNFDRNVVDGAVNGVTRNFCDAAPSDRFFVRYKMTTNITEAGQYNFMLGSDDGVRLYIDGVKVAERWNQHSYTVDSFLTNLTAGNHNFILEYYEYDGSSRVAISYGLVKGDQALPYGDKVWNVYGFVKNDLNLANVVYAGNYVDPNLNVNSTTYWPVDKSPSSATIWQGAPVPNDNFTVSFRRQGFPCGTYRIELANSDDATQIYLDGNLIFTQAGYTNTPAYINGTNTYTLGSTSKIEVRLREDGGNANVAVNLVRVFTTYTGTETIPANSSLLVNSATPVTLGADVKVCSCTINSGSTLNVPTDKTLTVDEDINVLGTGKLVILSGGSLLQTTTSQSMYTGNATTSFEVQRTTNVRRYDLTYWSMPVTNPNFKMNNLSPNTLSDKYYTYDDNVGWVVSPNGMGIMEVGKGYSIRAPQNYDLNTATPFTGVFKGTPNNGTINAPVTAGQFTLAGNPYPSAISATALINGNTNLGTIYLWTHNLLPAQTVPGDSKYYYRSDDFASFNLTGGAGGAKLNGEFFKGYIAAGQGFITQPKTATLSFNNTMRINANNKQFYKTSETGDIERNRLWLNFSNDQGAFKQMLLGYIEGATNDNDINYDATTLGANSYVDFYSINESEYLTIQGRALPFDNKDVVPLGYKTTIAGEFTIAIDTTDGFFDTQEVYLEDLLTGKTINLRTEDYKFTTAAGTFSDRFNLRYTSKTLGTGDFETTENSVTVSVKSKVIKVATASENIKDVQIYNIGGQSVYNKNNIGSKELQISNLPSSTQVLLVKVILENGAEVTKKIIFN